MTAGQVTTDGAAAYAKQALAYRPLLFSTAYQMTRNPADADDLVAETYLKAHEHCASFQGTYLRGWLSRILTNTFINAYHARRRHPEVLGLTSDNEHEWTGPGAAARLAAPGSDPAEEVLGGLLDEGLKAALRSLPAANRRVVLLADVEGYSYKEIARITGSPIGTVMSRLHRGRQALKAALSPSGGRPVPAE